LAPAGEPGDEDTRFADVRSVEAMFEHAMGFAPPGSDVSPFVTYFPHDEERFQPPRTE
jgi:hypothetical protein